MNQSTSANCVYGYPPRWKVGCGMCQKRWAVSMESIPCGHVFCSTCFPEIKVCPLCCGEVASRRPAFRCASALDRVRARRNYVGPTAFYNDCSQKTGKTVVDPMRLTRGMGGMVPSKLFERIKKSEESNWKVMDLSGCTELLDARLLTMLASLEELNLAGYPRVRHDLEVIASLNNLVRLYLDETDADDRCIFKIRNKSLLHLSCVSCRRITDVRPLAETTTLQKLSLAGCKNIEFGLEEICELPHIRKLNLRGTQMNDACISKLSRNSNLLELDCGDCLEITDVKPLAKSKKLEVLTLEGCENIIRGLVDLCALPDVRQMNFSGTAADNACISKLGKSKKLVSLFCEQCPRVTNIRPLAKIKTLEFLSLSGSINISRGVGRICDNQWIRGLNFSDVDVRETDVMALADCDYLVSLNLSGCLEMTDLDAIEGCMSLESLSLCDCRDLADITSLRECRFLKTLDLSGCSSLCDISALRECARLKTLVLSRCTGLRDLSGLGECATLVSLDLSECHSLVDISALGGCVNLVALYLRGCNGLQDLNALKEWKSLRMLDLSGFRKLEDVTALRGGRNWLTLNLSNCENLKEAWLDGHDCRDLLALDLSNCENLKEVWLDGCRQLANLNLSNCKNMWYIHGQTECKGLVTLNLYNCGTIQNGIGDLLKLPRLTVLHIDYNNADRQSIENLRNKGLEIVMEEEEEEEEEGSEYTSEDEGC
ncbi:expression site-associated gene 8 (ESAG8) protein, putative [Trypanosoma equiperdum]|uniref:Leucine-rich repeat protein (LRRP), putative n=2 Tax=Trypanozoon TaxID=39700 RepID=A0A1G4I268_TRYEQ|nr:expression site-associated gene (ESAG) protein; expression site-associated gene 8 (ESAG8) [Trypanosoma brucei brucei TREU927]CAJ16577.1 expression site-associated gene (ESAG) protein, putative; expression site-associated gene 8 (ESAG8) protein, putative [Trypanosoma brucei brucei TREU927]SCU65744.1 expression site-associated gene 8 (ESAG8) protein, putative [Trypanosoma equiperdum]